MACESKEESASDSDEQDCNQYCLIITTTGEKRVLTSAAPNGRSELPVIRVSDDVVYRWAVDCKALESEVKRHTGISCRLVRPVLNRQNGMVNEEAVLVLQAVESCPGLKSGMRWVTSNDFRGVEWRDEVFYGSTVEMLTSFFNDNLTPSAPGRRPPWRFPGWITDTEEWVRSELSKCGMDMVSSLHYGFFSIASVVLSCRVRTLASPKSSNACEEQPTLVYVKATWSREKEATVVAELSRFASGVVPHVIAFNSDRNTFIQKNATYSGDELDFAKLARTLGELQLESLKHLADLRTAGLREITLDWLEKQVRVILTNPRLDKCEEKPLLSFLRGQIPALEEKCKELHSIGLPNTLVHGDLHEGNVGDLVHGSPSRHMIYDWGSAFIGNPLLDLVAICGDAENSDHAVLTSNYYGCWDGCGYTAVPDCALSYAKSLYWLIDIMIWLREWDFVEEVDREQLEHSLMRSVHQLGYDMGYESV